DEKLLDPALHNPDHAAELVQRAVQVKIDVVEEDPYEHGIRAYLNLGHTFAHAIERVTEYAWKHGDAVGAGLLAAAKLSHALGKVDTEFVERVDTILAETGLPRSLNGLNPADLYEAMKTDKKWKNGVSRFIVLNGMCDAEIVRDVPQETVIEVMKSMQ
ncbi:MAG: 3-dehydroquinate synthase family protein, partial [Aggregatilineales bacterium]